MNNSFKHGGGYKQACLNYNINFEDVSDYSTSINWKASDFHPENIHFNHKETIEYPDINYSVLKSIISEIFSIQKDHFLITNGANEAISSLFYMFCIKNFNKTKEIALIGPTYCEYNKYANICEFNSKCYSIEDFLANTNSFKNKIIVIVNPNTPLGQYFDLKQEIKTLLDANTILIVDESFIDFTDKTSLYELSAQYENLYLIHSMTKFFGSAGARLGLLINSGNSLENTLSKLTPEWGISAYDNWFYQRTIPKYTQIKAETFKWIKEINSALKETIENSENIKFVSNSITSYHTLKLNENYIQANSISNIQEYFLQQHKIFIRPTHDFYGCPENSFRVGLRLPNENLPLLNAIKDVK